MKICTLCKQELPATVDFFNKDRRRKDGFQNACRECNRERSRRYYAENKEKHREVMADRRRAVKSRNQQNLCEYLTTHPCVDCDETNIIMLDFDHTSNDKSFDVSFMIPDHSWEKVLEEIAKCEVVCANCHRLRTATRSGSYRLAYQALL